MGKKILCTLAFASELINDVAFEAVDGGMQSVDVVPDDVADTFLTIPGYEAVEFEAEEKVTAKSKKAAAAAAAEAEAAEAAAQQASLTSSTGRPFNCRERYERNWTSK